MRDGMYRVHFSTPGGAVGSGLLKVEHGVIHGADAGFMYSGSAIEEHGQLRGKVNVHQHCQGPQSVLGHNRISYEVEFSGTSNDDSFLLQGFLTGEPSARLAIVGWLRV